MYDTSEDAEFKEGLKKRLKNQSIARALFALRLSKNMTQQQLEKKTGLKQSKISKLEKLDNGDFKTEDLAKYCDGLGFNVELAFIPQKMALVDQVKNHFFRMMDALNRLESLAADDKELKNGIGDFFDEATLNMNAALLAVLGKADKLKAPVNKKNGDIQLAQSVTTKDFKRLVSGAGKQKALAEV